MSKSKHRINRVELSYLRAIRLHHWDEAMKAREKEREAAASQSNLGNMIANAQNRIASQHLTFVQQLNEFFEIGDYAEYDANKRDEAAKGAKT